MARRKHNLGVFYNHKYQVSSNGYVNYIFNHFSKLWTYCAPSVAELSAAIAWI